MIKKVLHFAQRRNKKEQHFKKKHNIFKQKSRFNVIQKQMSDVRT